MKWMSKILLALVAGVCGLSPAAELSSASYVRDGLTHQWDALENAGAGVHDGAAAVWKDLAGDADLACTPGQYGWGANYFQCGVTDAEKTTLGSAHADRALGDYRTVEVVFRGDGVGGSGRCVFTTGVKTRFCWLNGLHGCVQFSEKNPTLAFDVANNTGDIALAATYASASADAVSAVYRNGRAVATGSYQETWSQWPAVFTLGFGRALNYCFSGRIYTIRMYSRELTADELAANAAVDRVRFLGVHPAETTHVWTGAAGTGAWTDAGNWSRPDGTPAVSAPDASSVAAVAAGADPVVLPSAGAAAARLVLAGSGTARFAGGTLAAAVVAADGAAKIELNAAASLQAKTLMRDGVDVSRGIYTGQGAHGTRVDWVLGGGFCCVAGAQDKAAPVVCRGFGARDYVQAGLVRQWDALENAGVRVHDSDATVWKDLAGTADLACRPGQYAWGDGYFYSDVQLGSHASGSAQASGPIVDYRTVEVVYRSERDDFYKTCLFNSGVQDRFMWLIRNGRHEIQFAQKAPSVAVDSFARDTHVAATFASANPTNAPTASGVFLDGASVAAGAYNETWSGRPWAFTLGYGTQNAGYCFKGRIYAIRMYDRELTAAEIAANAALDRIRFFDAATEPTHVWTGAAGTPNWDDARNWSTAAGGAVAAAPSAVSIVSISAAAGSTVDVRLPRAGGRARSLEVSGAGTVRFTSAPETARPWALVRLEATRLVLDAPCALDRNVALTADGLERNGLQEARGCYTGSGPRGARVAWLAGAGVLSAGDGFGAAPCGLQDYTVENYVQEGLVAAWDGLENAGYGVHDPLSPVWKDLFGSRDLALGPAGSWGAGWLACAGGVGAQGREAYGDYRTIEVVYRSTDGAQLRQVVFDSGATYRFAVHNVEFGALQFAYGPMSGRLSPEDKLGDVQAAATFADTASFSGPSGAYRDGRPDAKTYSENWTTCGKLTVGMCANQARVFRGRVYAIRLYGRELTAREIAKNAEVDAIRFFGAEPPRVRSFNLILR